MHYVYNNIYILFKCDIIINIYGCFIRSVLITDAETIIHHMISMKHPELILFVVLKADLTAGWEKEGLLIFDKSLCNIIKKALKHHTSVIWIWCFI